MQTLREKSTFILAGLGYLLFHLSLGPSLGAMLAGTVEQLLTTAPYCIGFTWILVVVLRVLHKGKRPTWDRIVRIYFTLGICFGFYFALYDYNDRAQQRMKPVEQQERRQERQQEQPINKSPLADH